ncbi:NTP/NDP exchange transporter [Flavobacterium subsaxonicum]|uniref:MFS transporter n=1 Tax=Flavobacterium subsaxonicum WB 4.1-42 = DSM 21790 TaxID=1121898 RepID=A0A0A2MF97_9FLAO|nr:MFS transporter [Flavobacterium subsaxonicum]KGO90964.1 MFS transporter [Flavobacterium subsaxonicum WB 4.1-42 = DSM 21790]
MREKKSYLNILQHIVDVKKNELAAVCWAFLYIFVLFIAYYVMRPIRDELGVAGGVDNLSWLFTGTLIAMVALNPLYAYATKRWPREKFIAITYRFFIANLIVFFILLGNATPEQQVWIGRAFFIWVSVFNLFVVSVYWSVVVDVFDAEQGKRLFSFLAAGATLGGIAGSALTTGLVEHLGQKNLLLLAAVLLEIAILAARKLSRLNVQEHKEMETAIASKSIGGSLFSGFTHTLRSPYLMGISAFILLNSVTSTFLYFQQAEIAEANFTDRAARTAFFANIDLWVNALTLVFQLYLAGKLLKSTSVTLVLCSLPFISIIGFTTLALIPSITLLVIVQVARRVSNFGLSRPTREILFTSISREDRYKAKNFIDTVVYRGGDQVGSWSYTGLGALGLGIAGISIAAVPISIIWLSVSYWLGSKHSKIIAMSTAGE